MGEHGEDQDIKMDIASTILRYSFYKITFDSCRIPLDEWVFQDIFRKLKNLLAPNAFIHQAFLLCHIHLNEPMNDYDTKDFTTF